MDDIDFTLTIRKCESFYAQNNPLWPIPLFLALDNAMFRPSDFTLLVFLGAMELSPETRKGSDVLSEIDFVSRKTTQEGVNLRKAGESLWWNAKGSPLHRALARVIWGELSFREGDKKNAFMEYSSAIAMLDEFYRLDRPIGAIRDIAVALASRSRT